MAIKKEENLGERLVTLIELNKAKYELLFIIKDYELNNKNENKEYYQMMDLYKYTCSLYNKKLTNIDYVERLRMIDFFKSLNPKFSAGSNIFNMLLFDEKKIIYSKTLLDLGAIEFHLYNPNSNKVNIVDHVLSILNAKDEDEEEEEDTVNEEMVDNYMVSDFLNMLYKCVQDEITTTTDINDRKDLINFKYNIIFLFEVIETRNVLTNFSVPEYPNMACEIEVETTGISFEDYLDRFDSVLSTVLENNINAVLSNLAIGYYKDVDVLNKVYIKNVARLLCDKELLESVNLNVTNVKKEYLEAVSHGQEVIKDILLEIGNEVDQLPKYRKYRNI